MKLLAVVILLLVLPASDAQAPSKQRISQPAASAYPLRLHVTHSLITQNGNTSYLHLTGILDGANVELIGGVTGTSVFNMPLLPPGDYTARLAGEDAKRDASRIQQYDVSLAGGQHEVFTVIGRSE